MLCANVATSAALEPETVTLPVTTTWPAFTSQTPLTVTLEYVPPASDAGVVGVPEHVVAAAAAAVPIALPPSAPSGTTNSAATDATASRAALRPLSKRQFSKRPCRRIWVSCYDTTELRRRVSTRCFD